MHSAATTARPTDPRSTTQINNRGSTTPSTYASTDDPRARHPPHAPRADPELPRRFRSSPRPGAGSGPDRLAHDEPADSYRPAPKITPAVAVAATHINRIKRASTFLGR
ncbi:hypothetical protein Ae331Ps2_6002 [Pseudonocardia sp. Ae331_Ps2]|nr:hypothetical protein Ae331Ps2_6002 [Pseudonocardia sp. Ae331_Ps2]